MSADRFAECGATRRGRFDIRFKNDEQETQFKLSSQQNISTSMFFMALLSTLCYFVIVIRGYAMSMSKGFDPFSLRFDEAGIWMFWIDTLLYLVFACVILCFVPIYRITSCLTHWNLEAFTVMFLTLWSAWLPWGNFWSPYLNRDLSAEVVDAHKKAAAGSVVLALDTITTALCLFVPIRLIVKWIPPVVGLVSFVLSGYFDAPTRVDLPLNNIILIFGLTVCALMGAWNNEVSARERFIYKSEVVSKQVQLEQQHAGLSKILDRLCDSLVHLTENLTISNANPRLGALLMSTDWKRLSGARFCDYITNEEDRQTFVSSLHETPSLDNSRNDGMVNLHMRDVIGREFLVYAYHASYRASDGESHHVVGLVEAVERPALAPDKDSVNKLRSRSRKRKALNRSSVDTSVFADALLGAVFEISSSTFEVETCSNYSSMFESIEGHDFSRIFVDQSALTSWFAAIASNDSSEDDVDMNLGPARIILHGFRGGHRCKLICEVEFEVVADRFVQAEDNAEPSGFVMHFQVRQVNSVAFERSLFGTNANSEWESLSSRSQASNSDLRIAL
eukprot:TRINITY_DN28235_c0_g1_i1.p1 TRINITY_DN28235_c0_g1~~TRINITY_DN28235_c0_g1_i1.p1  ORF type:complete len:563 (-),score=59.33 TRINITY_DN28235_c0_g1_i1:208-1896(-)